MEMSSCTKLTASTWLVPTSLTGVHHGLDTELLPS